ncbi:hypothetical protein C5167_016707 [Papaver somniferum]|nr:hypothetical protein C5167_016707 [Papaver somniferum]
MITGSYSSTLDRLYAWEMKLYDEVKKTIEGTAAYSGDVIPIVQVVGSRLVMERHTLPVIYKLLGMHVGPTTAGRGESYPLNKREVWVCNSELKARDYGELDETSVWKYLQVLSKFLYNI